MKLRLKNQGITLVFLPEYEQKKKNQKPSGFWFFEVPDEKQIISWRTLSAALDFVTEGSKILSGSYVS